MLKVSSEKFNEVQRFIEKFNQADLGTIEFVEGDKVIRPTPEQVRDFKFTGLSNWDFFRSRYWEPRDHCIACLGDGFKYEWDSHGEYTQHECQLCEGSGTPRGDTQEGGER